MHTSCMFFKLTNLKNKNNSILIIYKIYINTRRIKYGVTNETNKNYFYIYRNI